MLIRVNPKDGLPVYLQIVRQVKHQVVSGALHPGERLPSAKELAVRLLVNANTVAKAYTELERDGVVMSRRGSGTYIAETPVTANAREKLERLRPLMTRLVVEARQLGVPQESVSALLGKTWKEVDKS